MACVVHDTPQNNPNVFARYDGAATGQSDPPRPAGGLLIHATAEFTRWFESMLGQSHSRRMTDYGQTAQQHGTFFDRSFENAAKALYPDHWNKLSSSGLGDERHTVTLAQVPTEMGRQIADAVDIVFHWTDDGWAPRQGVHYDVHFTSVPNAISSGPTTERHLNKTLRDGRSLMALRLFGEPGLAMQPSYDVAANPAHHH